MRTKKSLLALAIVVVLLVNGFGCQTLMTTKSPTSAPAPARFVLGDLTITPTAIMAGENVTYSIQTSNIGGTEGSYPVVFKYKSTGGSIGSDNVEVTLKPGQTKAATLTTTKNESGTYFVNVNNTKNSQYTVKPIPTPIYGIPATSASAITSPPPSMIGINTHTEVYGMDADPNMITLGPKLGGNPRAIPYAGKPGMVFELKHGTPLLAPIDMVLVGFLDKNNYRITDGQKVRNSDLNLFFESVSPDWPGMIMRVYHIYSSSLLIGHDGSKVEDWGSVHIQAQGHLFDPFDDYVTEQGNPSVYEALMGYKVKRGELIGFAGTVAAPDGVGTHSFADFCFKVSDTSENPTVQKGNRYLHWVQPDLFFYWKSYSPDANFPSGVLAYPFECDGYQLPAEQHDVNFKYKVRK